MERSSAATLRAQALRAHSGSPSRSSPPSRQAELAAISTSSPTTPSRSSTRIALPEIDEASPPRGGNEWSASDAWDAAVNGPSKEKEQRKLSPPQRMRLDHHRLSPAAASSPLLGGHHDDGSDYFIQAADREQAVTPASTPRPRAPRTPSVFATPNVPATIEEGSEPGSPVKKRFSSSPQDDSDGDSTKSGVKSEGSHPRVVELEQAHRQPSIMDLVSATGTHEDDSPVLKAMSRDDSEATTPIAEVRLHAKPSINDIAFPSATHDEQAPPPPLRTSPPPPSSSSDAATSPSLRHRLSISPSSSSSPLRRFIKRSISRSSSMSMRSEAESAASRSSRSAQRHDEAKQPATTRALPEPPARDSSLRENRQRKRSSASLHDEDVSPPSPQARARRLSASLPKSWRKRLSSLSIKREGKKSARLSLAALFDRGEDMASYDEAVAEAQQEEADLLAALEAEAAWQSGQGSLGRANSVQSRPTPIASQVTAAPDTTSRHSLQSPARRPLLRRKHALQLPEPLISRPASVGSSTIRGHKRQSTASSIRPPSSPPTPFGNEPIRNLTRKRSMSHSGVTRLRPELFGIEQTSKRATPLVAPEMAPSRSLPPHAHTHEWTSALGLASVIADDDDDDEAATILSTSASASPEAPRRPRLASLDRPTQFYDSKVLPKTLRTARLRWSTLPPPVEFNVEEERRRRLSGRSTRPRPSSLVLGPFDLQVPEMPTADEEEAKAQRRLRHRSLPAALNLREKVMARRQLRRMRRSIDLALGLSVPLQLSFAAGLGWNEQTTSVDVDDYASGSEATSADTDEAVTAPNTTTRPSVDDEMGAAEQKRRIAARKLSMDLLEGRARATPSPSPAVPVQPRSSSMAMAFNVAALVDGPEWSAGKMRATIRRANTTTAVPGSVASTSSFYGSWSDVGERRRRRPRVERLVLRRRRRSIRNALWSESGD